MPPVATWVMLGQRTTPRTPRTPRLRPSTSRLLGFNHPHCAPELRGRPSEQRQHVVDFIVREAGQRRDQPARSCDSRWVEIREHDNLGDGKGVRVSEGIVTTPPQPKCTSN